MRRHILWLDATANLSRTATRDGVRRIFEKARESGFTTIVVDIKPTSGEVLYPSRVAPRLRHWKDGLELPEGYDLLGTAVETAESVGLELFAGLNVFVEGCVQDGRLRGAVLADPRRAAWRVVAYRPRQDPWVFVNPALPEVQAYELRILEEVVRSYPVAAVVLDRARFPGIYADLGRYTRHLLEERVAVRTRRWPEDVYRYTAGPGDGTIRTSSGDWVLPGPFFGPWLELRAWTIRQFVAAARDRIQTARPGTLLGVYAGSWYPTYYELGVNWANPALRRALEYLEEPVRSLVPEGYPRTGYQDLLDFFISGNYYSQVGEEEVATTPPVDASALEPAQTSAAVWWATVAGAARLVREVTGHLRPLYGGLYMEQYRDRPDRAKLAVRTCLDGSDGVMVFDASHVERFGWWSLMKEALN